MKKNLLLISMLLLISVGAISQNEKMIMTTAKTVGSEIKLAFYVLAADQADVWVDLNNDGVRDEGETPTFTVPSTNPISTGIKTFELGSQTITIYGRVYRLDCYNNLVTALDASTNTQYLKNLQCYNNMISGANMTAMINSLRNVEGADWSGTMVLIDSQNPNEQNVAFDTDVQIAKDKKWDVMDKNGSSSSSEYIRYEGVPTGSGVEDVNSANLKVWSSEGLLNISSSEPGLLEIHNLLGQQVFSQLMQQSTTITVPLRQGIYTVRVKNMTKKVIIN